MNNQLATNPSLSITEESKEQTTSQKIGGICVAIAILALIAAMSGAGKEYPKLFFTLIVMMFTLGAVSYAWPYFLGPTGVRNNNIMFKSMTNKGTVAWIMAVSANKTYTHG